MMGQTQFSALPPQPVAGVADLELRDAVAAPAAVVVDWLNWEALGLRVKVMMVAVVQLTVVAVVVVALVLLVLPGVRAQMMEATGVLALPLT